jgi:hypothetical protein
MLMERCWRIVRRAPETRIDTSRDRRRQCKTQRLEAAGFSLSRNDHKIVLHAQLLTTIVDPSETTAFASLVEG